MKNWTIDELMVLSAGELKALRQKLTQALETEALPNVARSLVLETLGRIEIVFLHKISRPSIRPGPGGLRPPSP